MQINFIPQPWINRPPESCPAVLVESLLNHAQPFVVFPVQRAGSVDRMIAAVSYESFKDQLSKEVIPLLSLNPAHKGHDGRKTFVTMAKKAKLDEYAIKRIVGHHIDDLTERIYTERSLDWLKSEIEKMP